MNAVFDPELVRRYGGSGPRYTSYPTALQFSEEFDEPEYRAAAERSRAARPGAPLSVYVHVPFCTSPCFYCGCNRIITRQWAMADGYLQRLAREIELQGALFERVRTIEQLHFGGGTPSFLNVGQLDGVMQSLDRRFGLSDDERREYSIEIDPRTLSVEMVPQLAGLGFNRMSIGVQDFDPRVQRAVNRVQSVKDTLDLLGAARSCGFRSLSVDLIYGLPLQTPLSWGSTLDVIVAARPDRIAAYGYAHMPQLFKAQRQIRAQDVPTPEQRLELLQLTVARLTAAGYVHVGMDHFALPGDELAMAQRAGTLQRNFQGYSTRGGLDLVGLGLSAIGSLDDTYAQNARRLEGYYAALDAGRLPIERGLRLTAEDRLRRDVIMALMCRGELCFSTVGRKHGIDFADHFAAELAQLRVLERDRLVDVDDGAIRVTPLGRWLVRVVARVFDAHASAAASSGVRRHSAVI